MPKTFGKHKCASTPWTPVEEPKWADPDVLLDTLDEVGAASRPIVSAALSTGVTRTIEELRITRNFYAHRGEDTRLRVAMTLGATRMPPHAHPTAALSRPVFVRGVQRPQPLIADWVDDLRDALESMV